jgi:hypothetical protein
MRASDKVRRRGFDIKIFRSWRRFDAADGSCYRRPLSFKILEVMILALLARLFFILDDFRPDPP